MAGNRPSDSVSGQERTSSEPAPTSRSITARLAQTFLKPAKPRAETKTEEPARELTDEEKRVKVLEIDRTERKIGYAAAILAAVLAVVTFVPYIDSPLSAPHPTTSPIKGTACPTGYSYEKVSGHFTCLSAVAFPRSHWVTELAIVAVFALAVSISVRIGRRSAVAFTVLMTGLALMSVVETAMAIPFIFAGGWLMTRAWRVQRYGTPTARGPGDVPPGTVPGRARSRAPRGPRESTGTASTRPKKRGRPAPSGPAANKRYTPKSPQRRRPPPPT
jgi:hypothetical protein